MFAPLVRCFFFRKNRSCENPPRPPGLRACRAVADPQILRLLSQSESPPLPLPVALARSRASRLWKWINLIWKWINLFRKWINLKIKLIPFQSLEIKLIHFQNKLIHFQSLETGLQLKISNFKFAKAGALPMLSRNRRPAGPQPWQN